MNKLLLGTMLMAQTINPNNAIITNATEFNKTYQNTQYTVLTDDQYEYEKVRISESLSYENDVIKIESKVSYQYYNDQQGGEQYLMSFNVMKITPKTDITNYTYEIKSYYSQTKLTYTTGSVLQGYGTQNYANYGTYVDAFLNMTSYNKVVVNSLNNNVCTVGNKLEEVQQNATNNIINTYGNIGPNEIQTTLTGPTILIFKLYYVNNYGTYGTEEWQNTTTFLYGQPSTLTGSYKWTVNTDDVVNIEVIDVPGLLLTILGMPFAFISQAFDLTIFPGNPVYEINLAHIFMAIIAAGIIIFIIKKVLK